MNRTKNNPQSLVMLLISMVIYGSIGIFRRALPLSSGVLACFRGACGALVLMLFFKAQHRKWHALGRRRLALLILSGAAMGFNWILLFEAYNYTSIPVATLCYYMQPTLVMLLSPFLFGERLNRLKALCVATALIGMALVSGVVGNGLPEASEGKGILLGLGAACLYATVIVLNKKLPGIDAYEKTIVQLLSAAAALVPYLLLTGQKVFVPLGGMQLLLLAVVGIVHTGLAYALYFGSMDGLRTQTVALLSYLDPVTSLLLAAAFLGERLTPLGLIGAVLIIGSALESERANERETGKVQE